MMDTNNQSGLKVSVVCPFYNEEKIIYSAVTTLLQKLKGLTTAWELIVVNDGSTDNSGNIVSAICKTEPRLVLAGYRFNRGRGHALRTGIMHARGDIIVTTEIDLSWGEDIVERLLHAMEEHPEADIIVASPHLKGGGYKNVPRKRVFFSTFGNLVIRAFMTNAVTMNTGMTRAYRREVIQSIPLEEDHKEFHLEVILKAQALNYRIYEIPCILEWKDYKHEGNRIQRKSSSKINRLVLSHSLFSIFANPIRHVWGISAASILLSTIFLIWSIVRLLSSLVSVFTVIISLSFGIIALLFFVFGVFAQQGYMIQKEMWSLKRDLIKLREDILHLYEIHKHSNAEFIEEKRLD